jgi:WXG100 family type VII secretion target
MTLPAGAVASPTVASNPFGSSTTKKPPKVAHHYQMATRAPTEADVAALRSAAQAYRHLATCLDSMRTALNGAIQTAHQGWTGDAATANSNWWSKLSNDLNGAVAGLRHTADQLDTAADKMQSAINKIQAAEAAAAGIAILGVALTIFTVGASDAVAGGIAAGIMGAISAIGIEVSTAIDIAVSVAANFIFAGLVNVTFDAGVNWIENGDPLKGFGSEWQGLIVNTALMGAAGSIPLLSGSSVSALSRLGQFASENPVLYGAGSGVALGGITPFVDSVVQGQPITGTTVVDAGVGAIAGGIAGGVGGGLVRGGEGSAGAENPGTGVSGGDGEPVPPSVGASTGTGALPTPPEAPTPPPVRGAGTAEGTALPGSSGGADHSTGEPVAGGAASTGALPTGSGDPSAPSPGGGGTAGSEAAPVSHASTGAPSPGGGGTAGSEAAPVSHASTGAPSLGGEGASGTETPSAGHGSTDATPVGSHGSTDSTPVGSHGSTDSTPVGSHGSTDSTPVGSHGRGSTDSTPVGSHGSEPSPTSGRAGTATATVSPPTDHAPAPSHATTATTTPGTAPHNGSSSPAPHNSGDPAKSTANSSGHESEGSGGKDGPRDGWKDVIKPNLPQIPAAAAQAGAQSLADGTLVPTASIHVGVAAGAALPGHLAVAHGSVTVAPGESLWSIAQKVYGDGGLWHRLWMANRALVPNPDQLAAGTQLVIP